MAFLAAKVAKVLTTGDIWHPYLGLEVLFLTDHVNLLSCSSSSVSCRVISVITPDVWIIGPRNHEVVPSVVVVPGLALRPGFESEGGSGMRLKTYLNS